MKANVKGFSAVPQIRAHYSMQSFAGERLDSSDRVPIGEDGQNTRAKQAITAHIGEGEKREETSSVKGTRIRFLA